MSKTIVKIHFNNGCTSLLYDDSTAVHDLIRMVIKGRLCQNELRYKKCYQIRATKYNDTQDIVAFKWLPYNKKIKEILQTLESDNLDCWKFVLRVRYLPSDFAEVKFKDRVTFAYYYEQIKNDFMIYEVKKIDDHNLYQQILELGCLEMRRAFQNMRPNILDKKINFEYLEKDVGLKRFFPENVLQYKSKNIKKLIIKGIKEYENHNEEECMLIFLEKLKNLWKYDTETYDCHLSSAWNIPIKLVLNYDLGISCYMNESREVCNDCHAMPGSYMRDPFQVIQYEKMLKLNVVKDDLGNFYLLQLKLTQTEEPLIIKLTNSDVANNLALLMNGYYLLKLNTDENVWSDDELNKSAKTTPLTTPAMKKNALKQTNNIFKITNEDDSEYSFIDQSYEIERDCLDFIEKLGSGQFGDVYKGTFRKNKNEIIDVAIKMLKVNEDNDDDEKSLITNKFIQEAKIMQAFDHQHIIKLIGVCSEYPSLIIMELAVNGQLRKYLQLNMNKIDIATLILYCYQLNTAMSYLESKKFVHRDIAARNVLVFSPECVKLADFGLSREVEENFYLASKSKLPIKWLAPESINFRKFTSSSDVWMFGVCMWEILTYGEKPFQGIKNTDVIHLIENKQRLEKPHNCPDELYSIILCCWEYDPIMRPKFSKLNDVLHSIYTNYKERKTLTVTSPNEFKKFNFPSTKINSTSTPETNGMSCGIGGDVTSDEVNLPPPKPRRISTSNPNGTLTKFQYPNVTSDLVLNKSIDLQNHSKTLPHNSKATLNSDSTWLEERLKILNFTENYSSIHLNVSSRLTFLSPTPTQQQQQSHLNTKDAQLRDHTYAFIQKITNFVHSLSKETNLKLDNIELKQIMYSWTDLCATYESYPVVLSKSKTINELVENLDNNLTNMVEELKQNNLEKVISIALELARKANNLFCTIASAASAASSASPINEKLSSV